MAEHILLSGYFGMAELRHSSAGERTQPRETPADVEPCWERLIWKMLNPKAPPAETEQRRAAAVKEVGISRILKLMKFWPASERSYAPDRRRLICSPKLLLEETKLARRVFPIRLPNWGRIRGPSKSQIANEQRKQRIAGSAVTSWRQAASIPVRPDFSVCAALSRGK